MHSVQASSLAAQSSISFIPLALLFLTTLEQRIISFDTAVLLDDVLVKMPVQDQGCAPTCFYFVVSDLVQSYAVRHGNAALGFSAAWMSSCNPILRQLTSGFALPLRGVSHYPYPVWGTYDGNIRITAALVDFKTRLALLGMTLNGTHPEEIVQATSGFFSRRKAAALLTKLRQAQVFEDFPVDSAACDILGDDRCSRSGHSPVPCEDSDVETSNALQLKLEELQGKELQQLHYEARFRRQLWQQSPVHCFSSSQRVYDDGEKEAETDRPEELEVIIEALKSHSAIGILLCADKLHTFSRKQGILSFDEPCLRPDHNVVLVGLNMSSMPPFWIVRNTWGQAWGENGYFRMAVNSKCGIQSMASYAVDSLNVLTT